LSSRNGVAGVGPSAWTGRVASIDSSMRLIMTAMPRSLLLDPPPVATSTTIYSSDFWLWDRQRAIGKRRTVAANAVLSVGCAESSDRGAEINCGTLASALPRPAGRRKRWLIIRCAILCVVCPAALGAGLFGGALVAQNQPVSVLESSGFSLEIPRFLATEVNGGRTARQDLVLTAPEASPKSAM
jgi:hypothetical protein